MTAHAEQVQDIAAEVIAECGSQVQKFGIANHPSFTSAGLPLWASAEARQTCQEAFELGEGSWEVILVEEVCEAIEARDGKVPQIGELREELIQVAAVAISWIASLDRQQVQSGDILSSQEDKGTNMGQAEISSGFNAGDRVEVEDAGLAMLRKIAPEGAAPNHHGEIQELEGDTAFVLFDDTKSLAPYPVSALKILE